MHNARRAQASTHLNLIVELHDLLDASERQDDSLEVLRLSHLHHNLVPELGGE
jgi:hypothetical protein